MKDHQATDLLFDLKKDPEQKISIAEEHPELIAELRKDLINFFKEIGTAKDIVEAWREPIK